MADVRSIDFEITIDGVEEGEPDLVLEVTAEATWGGGDPEVGLVDGWEEIEITSVHNVNTDEEEDFDSLSEFAQERIEKEAEEKFGCEWSPEPHFVEE